MRQFLYKVIEPDKEHYIASYVYDIFMMTVIVASLIPLAFKEESALFLLIDHVAVLIFIGDYLLRLFTADFALPQKGKAAFFLFPFTPMAIVDLLCILPSLTVLGGAFRLLKVLRLLRTFRVFRAFKLFRYSKSVELIVRVLRSQRQALLAVSMLAVGYIVLSALVIFNVEPDSFESFFDAVYWATISLTTVGYGDIYPVTTIGQIVTMVSSVLGIAIVALPAGIVTAGYMDELRKEKEEISHIIASPGAITTSDYVNIIREEQLQ